MISEVDMTQVESFKQKLPSLLSYTDSGFREIPFSYYSYDVMTSSATQKIGFQKIHLSKKY